MDDDLQVLTLPYNNDLSSLYSQTNNCVAIVLIVLQFLSLIGLLLISYLIPLADKEIHNIFTTDPTNALLSSFSITIYSNVLIWILLIAIRYYMRRVYYRRLRILGYYKHHSSVKRLSLIPSLVWHKTNAILLVLTTVLKDLDKDDPISSSVKLKPINCLQIVITIAFTIVIPFLSRHLYLEIRFRTDRNPPDVFCVEDPQHLVTSAGLNEIGVRPSSYLEDLLEKQADLIYNLKLQNTHLRQMLYKVSQRSNRESLQSS